MNLEMVSMLEGANGPRVENAPITQRMCLKEVNLIMRIKKVTNVS